MLWSIYLYFLFPDSLLVDARIWASVKADMITV